MAIKTIEYNVNSQGITPVTEQMGGTQGDHRVTKLKFTLSQEFYNSINDAVSGGKAIYRFDIYDGEGGIWQSEILPLELEMSMELEERHTRFGGKITVYLVITVVSADNETQLELYSFPVVVKLKNRPSGTYQERDNYESVTTLAQNVQLNANVAVQAFEGAKTLAQSVEQKLEQGEFDGVGIENIEIINEEMIVKYTDGSLQNLGNVKGEKGDKGEQGPKGDKGDMPDVSGFVSKVKGNGHTDQVYAVNSFGQQTTLDVEENGYFFGGISYGDLPRRQSNGNLMTNTPVGDLDCANKKYVDDLVGDLESLLGGI